MLQKSGKSSNDYVQGNTALIGHDSNAADHDQGYDEYIDITSGLFNNSGTGQAFVADNECSARSVDGSCFVVDDLNHFNSDDLEEMDILHQLALLSFRTNKFSRGLEGNFQVFMGKQKSG